MKHQKVYDYFKSAVELSNSKHFKNINSKIAGIDDFSLSQRQEILSAYFEEATNYEKDSLLNDQPVDHFTGYNLIKFGLYNSDLENDQIRCSLTNIFWHNILSDLENIFDQVEVDMSSGEREKIQFSKYEQILGI